ncbi:LAFA_0F13344g1_1 [Lachancea sp. 'fantastica']|nr:LAFA_0F13344g1_1 [Lachancea sp. 'fantastica']
MSSEWAKSTLLARLAPSSVGLLVFDENCNVLEASGVGKDRLEDIVTVNRTEVDGNGFGSLEGPDLKLAVYKRDGNTIVIYSRKNN